LAVGLDKQKQKLKLLADVMKIVDRTFKEEYPDLKKAYGSIRLDKASYNRIAQAFMEIVDYICSKMVGETLDFHKIAAAIEMAVIKCSPIRLNNLSADTGVTIVSNYAMAQQIALSVILDYQLSSYCTTPEEKNRLRAKCKNGGFRQFPDEISNDHMDASLSMIYAMAHATRCRQSTDGAWVAEVRNEIVWLLSSIYFFIDSHSQAALKEFLSDIESKPPVKT
jgi:hypothetical protein